MRSFNKARLIDIHEMNLDPTQHHIAGPDGRLQQQTKVHDKQDHVKEKEQLKEVALEETLENTVEELEIAEEQPRQVVTPVSKKTKKKTSSKN